VQNADGSYSYSSVANYNGADSFTYTVTDGSLVSNIATVRINVTAVNDAPTLGNQSLSVAEDTLLNGNLLASAADIEGSALTARVIAGPAHGSLTVNANGTFSYQGSKDYFGSDSFTYRVNDGQLDSALATVSLSVTAVNDAPVASDVTVTTLEDTATTINLVATDVDTAGTSLVFSIQTQPLHGSLLPNPDGSYRYAPAANYNGPDSFTYTVSDGSLTSNVATVRITVTAVNDAPVAQDLALTLIEDGFVVINIAALNSDVDGDTLTLTVGAAANGSLTRQPDGTYRYAPTANFNGADSISYATSDGQLSASGTIRLTITPVNDAPVAANDTATVLQGQSVSINVLANDSDIDSVAASLRPVILTQSAHGTVVVNANGTVSYTPVATYSGPDNFTYATSDGIAQATAATVNITVTPSAVNHPPVFTSTPPSTITLGAPSPVAGDSLFQATGTTGSTAATFKITERGGTYLNEVGYYRTDDASGRIGTLLPGDVGYAAAALANTRAVTVFGSSTLVGASASATVPAGQYVGFYLIQNASISTWRGSNSANSVSKTPLAFFSFQAANPDSFDHLHAALDATGKLTLGWEDLTNGGDQDFNDIVFTATGFKQPMGSTPATVFTYDANASDADGDTITFGLAAAPTGATINAQTGIITWSPTAAGSYSFSVTAADGKGGSTVQAFTLTVKAANLAPLATADSASTNEDTSVNINVLANDQDANGDALSATMLTGPAHGKLLKNADGSFNYTPDKDWFGTDSFTYIASDGKASSNVATVTITVKAVNDAPVAANASYTLQKDGSITIDLRTLASDVDGDTLTITLTNPTKGTLTKNANGTYTYKPNKGYTGNDSFSYTVSDGKLTATGSINLKVGSTTTTTSSLTTSTATTAVAATSTAIAASTPSAKTASSASIVVTSSAQSTSPASSSEEEQEIHYVVINSGAQGSAANLATLASSSGSANTPAINWGASSTAASLAGGSPPPSQANSWLTQLLATAQADEPVDLGTTTGLKVKL
jgi:large repetitive protein